MFKLKALANIRPLIAGAVGLVVAVGAQAQSVLKIGEVPVFALPYVFFPRRRACRRRAAVA